jgi:hypothetical protein
VELATQENPDKLERGFNTYIDCTSTSKLLKKKEDCSLSLIKNLTGSEVECDNAADYYECGAQKMPDIFQDMITVGEGSPTVVFI